MARKSLSDDLAGRAAKTLYDLRTRLSRSTPQAFSAEPPDAKTGARIPTHPGATAYFDGETKSFYERYGEAILTGVWGLSIFGSGIADRRTSTGLRRLCHDQTRCSRISKLRACRSRKRRSKQARSSVELRA